MTNKEKSLNAWWLDEENNILTGKMIRKRRGKNRKSKGNDVNKE
jgi:hypothetical protein